MTRDEFIAHLREQLLTQDNACTSYPMFVVQKRVTDFGFDPDYCDDICFIDADGDYPTVYPGDARRDDETPSWDELELMYKKDELPNWWARTGYKRRWEFVTACLTREAAEQYIQDQRHNLGNARVYVKSGYLNQEWIRLREMIMDDSERAEVSGD